MSEMRDIVDDVIDSLASARIFKDAIDDEDPYVEDTTSDGTTYDAVAAYNRLRSQLSARYSFTDFTRFGIWKSEERDNAADTEPSVLVSAFAYSPLNVVEWTSNDRLPRGGAEFYGTTLAIQGDVDTTSADADEGKLYGGDADATIFQGDIVLRIDWDNGTTDGDIAVNVIISSLQDYRGRRWNNSLTEGTTTYVDRIEIRAPQVSLDTGDHLAFATTVTSGVDIDYRAFGGGSSPTDDDSKFDAALTGIFLGYDDDLGPRAIVGNWKVVGDGTHASIQGVYGADRSVRSGNP